MLADIQRLSIAERIQLVEEIWDTIATEPEALPITGTQCEEIDRRLDSIEQNPKEGISWPVFKAKLTKR